MGSLSVQPPSGLSRNLTDVFNFLRSNAQTQSNFQVEFNSGRSGGGADDKIRLISLDEERGEVAASVAGTSRTPPSWVNVLDEINYEMTRIKTRQASLKELQQKHLVGLNFNDEHTSPEQEKIKELTDELTTMFSHTRRLIRLLEESETTASNSSPTFIRLRENVVASLMLSLNNLLAGFRSSQSNYLKQLDSRASNVDNFLLPTSSSSKSGGGIFDGSDNDWGLTSSIGIGGVGIGGTPAADDGELTIDQIQQIMQNEHMTKEREKEVVKISKSILELNNLFKDISALVLDQGTILDRIDYNVERSVLRIKAAHKHVEKAQGYQKSSRKMQLILILSAIALFLMLLILLTKF